MRKFSQNSIVDFLVDIMPSLMKDVQVIQDGISNKHAKMLYSIWANKKNKIGSKTFKKPINFSNNEIEELESEGLIHNIKGKLQITAKGSDVIKKMILGDDRSSWEDDGSSINYSKASSNVNSAVRKKSRKTSSKYADIWWKRFE